MSNASPARVTALSGATLLQPEGAGWMVQAKVAVWLTPPPVPVTVTE
jgi:hypothetical protein